MTNRLARETSPYLLQHADNPVAWQPWDAAALAQAERENRPILLSIGYSACHWCHVMAHESFEDESTAALMNELFVNIKVDREERPDLDRIYQIAHQLLARRPGGWPLTVFLTPRDRMPFFAGTYFPRLPRHGMPAFGEMLQRVAAFHREHAADIAQQNDSLADVFRRIEQGGRPASGAALNRAPIQAARQLLETEFDARHGGFGGAPKFPQPGALALFLGAALRGDRPAERMALFSLERMAAGGLFDQVGGGFFRYCVDAAWEIPHFEKMLYDNAALLPLYAEAAAHSGAPRFREAVTGTAAWLAREMRLDGGAFAASLDADNPEGEGANYTWSREELEARLPEDDLHLLERLYGLDAPPNFEGRWHLNLRRTPEQLGTAAGTDPDAIRRHRDAVHARLLELRQQRTPPGRDDKCLTAWNALLVTGLVRAGLLLDEPALCRQGETALQWLAKHAWENGRLYSVWTDGAVRQPAFLDDVAFLLQARLTALQYRWQAASLDRARKLADLLLHEYEDSAAGGFFFTPADGERLIHRPKSFADESLPAGNAVAAASLLQLGWLLGETRYLTAAERCLRAALPALERAPQAHCSLLNALDDFLDPPPQIVLRGSPGAMAAFRRQLPAAARVAIFAIPADADGLPPALQAHAARDGCVAYLCRGTHCEAPCSDPAELAGRLREQP